MLSSELRFPPSHPAATEVERRTVLERLGRALAAQQEIDWAYVHGSFTAGLPYRDVDLALWLAEDASALADPIAFEAGLGQALRPLAGAEVDVHVINHAPLGFQHAVLQGEAVLVRDEAALVEHIAQVGQEMMDFAYHRETILKELLRP